MKVFAGRVVVQTRCIRQFRDRFRPMLLQLVQQIDSAERGQRAVIREVAGGHVAGSGQTSEAVAMKAALGLAKQLAGAKAPAAVPAADPAVESPTEK